MVQKAENMLLKIINELFFNEQLFAKNLNPRNLDKSVRISLFLIRIRCQAKFLTSAKFLACYCFSVILLLRERE